mgnify:CR=1 FL=1
MKKFSSVAILCFFLGACSYNGIRDFVSKPTMIKYYSVPSDDEIVASERMRDIFSRNNLNIKLVNDDRVLKRYFYSSNNAYIEIVYFRQSPDVVRIALYKSKKLEDQDVSTQEEKSLNQVFLQLEKTDEFVSKDTSCLYCMTDG